MTDTNQPTETERGRIPREGRNADRTHPRRARRDRGRCRVPVRRRRRRCDGRVSRPVHRHRPSREPGRLGGTRFEHRARDHQARRRPARLRRFRRSGGFGLGGFGRFGARDITITAINGSDLSLKTDDGWTRTISVTSTTTITKGGATITVSDLAVGDQIAFAQDRATDGTYTVTAIKVILPTTGGQVTAIDGNTITVTQPGGTTATIHVDGNTKYQVNGAAGALSDIKVGSFIVAEGTQRSRWVARCRGDPTRAIVASRARASPAAGTCRTARHPTPARRHRARPASLLGATERRRGPSGSRRS